MAERRMFAKSIIDSDAFLDMPVSTQLLYFHLSMRADDDGFIGNPKRIIRMIGVNEDDLKVLIAKRFILTFESGVIVIKHWRINNYLQKDRYHSTTYQEELSTLNIDEKNAYKEKENVQCIQNGNTMYTQYSIGKDRLGKDSIGENIYISDELETNSSPKFIEIPLIDKTMYAIYEDDVANWQQLYPAVDIKQEFRKMVGWCNSNPKNRKTKNGINRFINNWLSRQQDRTPVNNDIVGQPQIVDQKQEQELTEEDLLRIYG